MQVVGHGGKEVHQTIRAEDVLKPAFPSAAFGGSVLGTQGPDTRQVFNSEKHHTPKLEGVKEGLVFGVDFRNRIKDHSSAIDQHNRSDDPFHITAGRVLG